MTRALPTQERPHEEIRLFGTVGVVCADRTGPPGPAAKVHAIPAGRASKVTRASRDIVACARKRPNGTGFQTPAPRAGFARARDRRQLGDSKLFGEANRATVGMPQAVIRVN
jgi:hypothetical protein